MALTRRQLLQGTGIGLGGVVFAGCAIPEREMVAQSPVLLTEDLVEGFDAFYATLCRQCPSPEGILVRVMEGRAKKIEGNPDYPVNRGKHGAKCEAGLQSVYHPDRITEPLKRVGEKGEGRFQPISWEAALDELIEGLRSHEDSPERLLVATEPIRGQLGMIVEKFVSAYGGQYLAFETLEETVLRTAIKRVFGQDRLPAFDIANSQFILSFGSDFLGSWLSPVHYSQQYGEFRQGVDRDRGTLVQVEPRFSLTAANADQWVPVKPGTEGILAFSIAAVIIRDGLADPEGLQLVSQMISPQELARYGPDAAATITGVSAERIEELARAFVDHQPGLALAGGSAAGHTNGLFNLTAAYALNLLVGNVGKPGGVLLNPDSPLKGLVNDQYAASFSQWVDITRKMQAGSIQMALIHGANPAYSMPKSSGFKEALANVPFVVSFSSFMDETSSMADLVLPTHVSLEDWGDDVPDPSPGFQTVGFQQPVVVPFGDTKGFGDVLLTVAGELGGAVGSALPWNSLRESVRASARYLYELNRGSTSAGSFEEFWMGVLQRGGWWDINSRSGQVANPSTTTITPELPVLIGDETQYPFHLIPFPSHSMGDGSGAFSPWLQATPDPVTSVTWRTWVEVNPKDARGLGIREGDVVVVESPQGLIETQVYVHPGTPPGIVGVPLGQGHKGFGRYADQRGANVMDLLSPELEQKTGALAWAATRVRIAKTDRRDRLPKAEGMVPSVQVEGFPVVQITRG